MNLRLVARLLIAYAVLAPVLAQAQDWWNDDWKYRKEVTLDAGPTGADLTTTQLDFPVLLGFSIGNFAYFPEVNADGSDLRFIGADGITPLDYHVESFDPETMIAHVWVQVPSISAGQAQNVYMYFGNDDAVAADDPASTYDKYQVIVYNFQDGLSSADRTAYSNNPVINAAADTASKIGQGLRFDGTGTVSIPASPSLSLVPAQGFTVSTWVKVDDEQVDAAIFELPAADGASLSVRLNGFDLTASLRDAAGGLLAQTPAGSASLTPQLWAHVALVADTSGLRLYLDGNEIASAEASLGEFGNGLVIGNGLRGGLDEFGVARVARDPGWIRSLADTQNVSPAMIVYGPSTSSAAGGGGGPNYFFITLANVTTDGWVVISILGVMAVVTWLLMAWKTIVIGRVRQQNKSFLEHFYSLGTGDPARLDREEEKAAEKGEPHFEASTVYHLYHLGIAQTQQRLEGKGVGADRALTLSPESVNAIRAALDAKMVRENQSLNSLMVLLTLAIAGGPFLGLLGTVMGVMITFAAIAHSGNVDVNSIAPGIAAALATTVAGLGVAIPALFGYNYLSSQIKEVSADMRVFLDEFVTRVGEYYS
jgi:biopolymer transport protein ExbB